MTVEKDEWFNLATEPTAMLMAAEADIVLHSSF